MVALSSGGRRMACEFSQRPAVFVCDSAWEMDLPSAQRRGVELLFFFSSFFLMTRSGRRWNLSHEGSAGARSDFRRLNGPQCSVGFKGFVWVSDSIESFSGRHASPLRERSSSPSLLAGVWPDASAFVSPPLLKMFFAAAQEFSSVIARMRCGRQELSLGGEVDWCSQLCTSHYFWFYFNFMKLQNRNCERDNASWLLCDSWLGSLSRHNNCKWIVSTAGCEIKAILY